MPLLPGTEDASFVYAGMGLAVLASWIAVTTLAGYAARAVFGGPRLLGLWGDMALAIIGGFGVGIGLRLINIDISRAVAAGAPALGPQLAVLIDVAVASLIGAAVIRLVLRLVFGGR